MTNHTTPVRIVFACMLLIMIMFVPGRGWGQVTVFSDDFSSNTSDTWTTSGTIGSSSWTVNRSGVDFGGKRSSTTSQLELTNDVDATANEAGWVFAYTTTTSYSSPYNSTLNLNPGIVTWSFNMRQIRSDPAGFGTGSYGVAFILGGTSTAVNNTGNGYAVVLGQSGSTDPVRLAKYTTGLSGTLTNIITSNTTGLTDFGIQYLSVKVTYNPSNNQWELFLRNDGTAFSDPLTGSLTTQGTATETTYTGTGLSYSGGYWSGSTGANQPAFFDNAKVTVVEVIAPTTQALNISFSDIQQEQMGVSWTNGNGNKRLVIINTSNSFTSPTDGSDPTANTVYSGSGEQVIFNNSTGPVTVTGLTASTTYWFRVYEYNGSGSSTKFLTSTATNNPNSQATSSASAPTITVSGTLSAFANTIIGNTSAEQNYTVSGSNLTGNISIVPPAGFEISTGTGGSFSATNPITLNQSGGTVDATSIYVRFAPSAAQVYSDNITHSSTGADQKTQAVSGTGIKAEPTNHPTGLSASTATPTYSRIDVTWTDASGGTPPDSYLIKASTTSYAAITAPVDGTVESDGTLVKNIAQGVQSASFTGLNASTPYYFKIYPYTNSGILVDYKTDGTVQQATATTDAIPENSYTWNVASGNWNTASSWTPDRTTPAASDILVFDGTVQSAPSVTLDFTSPQSIGRLRIINNASVTFSTSATIRTLNIGYTGTTSPQFEIAAGSALTVSAASAITLNILSGFTGSVAGNMTFQSAAHILKGNDASAVTFVSGSYFTAGTGFTGSPFGTTTPYNAIVFASGSTFIQIAGSNPFGATQPNSVVAFQSGSLYKATGAVTPSLSGRNYANLEYDNAATATPTGGNAASIDNLIISQGTFNFNMTATPGHSIKGNITIATGATLNFAPATAGTVNLNGTTTQTISGGGTLSTGTNSILNISADALKFDC